MSPLIESVTASTPRRRLLYLFLDDPSARGEVDYARVFHKLDLALVGELKLLDPDRTACPADLGCGEVSVIDDPLRAVGSGSYRAMSGAYCHVIFCKNGQDNRTGALFLK